MLDILPRDLLDAIAREACRDADTVAWFLRELGTSSPDAPPVHLPAAFLLGLGAALRLLAWESSDLRVHRDAGLPSARQAIVDAFAHLDSAAKRPRSVELSRRVVGLFAHRFAWHGRRELDADVVLDDLVGEDTLAEALA